MKNEEYIDRAFRGEVIGGGYKQIDLLCKEVDRLRAALEMIAQVRNVSGSAQGAFRSNLKIADAALAGKDVRDLSVVEELLK